jgi:hypothetical protein
VCRLVYRPRAYTFRTSIIVLRDFKIFNDDSALNALNERNGGTLKWR